MGNEKKEYAIGEVFRHTDGKVYQCVEGGIVRGVRLGAVSTDALRYAADHDREQTVAL